MCRAFNCYLYIQFPKQRLLFTTCSLATYLSEIFNILLKDNYVVDIKTHLSRLLICFCGEQNVAERNTGCADLVNHFQVQIGAVTVCHLVQKRCKIQSCRMSIFYWSILTKTFGRENILIASSSSASLPSNSRRLLRTRTVSAPIGRMPSSLIYSFSSAIHKLCNFSVICKFSVIIIQRAAFLRHYLLY